MRRRLSTRSLVVGPLAGGGQINVMCPPIVPSLGNELLTNGNMESGSPPSSWTAITATLTAAADERTGGTGAQSLQVARNGANFFNAYQKGSTAAGDWVSFTGWFKRIDAAQSLLQLYNDNGATLLANRGFTDTSWTQKTLIGRAIDTNVRAYLRGYSTGANGVSSRYDDASLKIITFSSMLAFLGNHASSGTFQCAPTVASGSVTGLILNYLDANNFAMILVDRKDGDTAKLIKRVSGTYAADVISGAITYSAGAILRVVVNGTSYSLYYNGTQVGTTQTISDALGNGVYGFNTLTGNTVGQVTTSGATS